MPVTFTLGLVLTILFVCASIGGLVIVRRWILASDLQTQHDVTDPLSQVVGMMFAVLLGFMVGDAMTRFAAARTTTQQEAASLADVFRLADGLPADKRAKIQALCLQYGKAVVEVEWPLLAQKKSSKTAWQTYADLSKECVKYEPKTQAQSNVQQSMLPAVVSLGDNRRLRVEALNSNLSPILWLVLLIGGAATILFTYFFGARDQNIQVIMVAIVSLVICLNIFLLASYDDPFSGDVMVHPTAFQEEVQLFQMDLNHTVPQDLE
jgi:hypothetical protein